MILYDCTLREGCQTPGVHLTPTDRIRLLELLDAFGFDQIEGGIPASGGEDAALFAHARRHPMRAKLFAFGFTARGPVESDPGLRALLDCECLDIALLAKAHTGQIQSVLGCDPGAYLEAVHNSIDYLTRRGCRVQLTAEHFFDGLCPESSAALLQTAQQAGATVLALCDTNGGTLPADIQRGLELARAATCLPLQLHAHDDGGLAVANSLCAAQWGVEGLQATVNGYGERCGNANWCTLLPTLTIKAGMPLSPDIDLANLTDLARAAARVVGKYLPSTAPYVGASAFLHKAGTHIDATQKAPDSFLHITPEAVGNSTSAGLSAAAGRAAVLPFVHRFFPDATRDDARVEQALALLKQREAQGLHHEEGEASFTLALADLWELAEACYRIDHLHVVAIEDAQSPDAANADVAVHAEGQEHAASAHGEGPVNAMDTALRQSLSATYPRLAELELIDYKVRVLQTDAGTRAKTHVRMVHRANGVFFGTVGASVNIAQASYTALSDAIRYFLNDYHIKGDQHASE